MIYQKVPVRKEWKEENLPPFDELMISWNSYRPIEGKFLFYVSVKLKQWSPWLLYASWGSDGQSSFQSTLEEAPVRVYQDVLAVLDGKKATAFQIKIVSEGPSIDNIHGLHVYTNSDKADEWQGPNLVLNSIDLQVPGLSQMTLDHKRHGDLCSPASTTAVVRYLSSDYTIDPVNFALKAWDSGFDLFGNWVLNVAQGAVHLGKKWDAWVDRFNSFNDIYKFLELGTPVVVSVRGPLPGSAQPYAHGHLIAVTGYDACNQKVICMDPAFLTDDETRVSYAFADFVQAWSRRGNIAYVFRKK